MIHDKSINPFRVCIYAKDYDTEKEMPVGLDSDTKAIRIENWVWNTDTLQPERMKQPVIESTGDLTVTMGDLEKISAGNYWKDKQYEYDENLNCIYKGFHTIVNADENATGRHIWKITYDVHGNNIRTQGPLIGTWANKENLGW